METKTLNAILVCLFTKELAILIKRLLMLECDDLTYSTILFDLDFVSATIKNFPSCWSRYQTHSVCIFFSALL